ncbi:hypothetical protein [Allonocardiopsis opalescens]|uniref:P68 RBP/TagC-like beta-propeller domain-containing protein n=1 Tax=Allonocardiopsis opalescens TaxID=1144618 RepID=A0A2T0PTM6_9ACTN|nr:hypothetical protein [Allonocardiopsis opalescens]PRX92148.1 hypothetical protein CLV72_11137 [Allonocardiopsis opalescens]
MPIEATRRQLLRAGAALGLAAALPAVSPAAPAAAGVPDSPRFDLTAPSTALLRERRLHNATVLQSLAFDNTNRRLFTVQLVQGGLTLTGESGPVSGAERARRGDLVVTRLDLSGERTGRMYLKGFGHGVQIGAEPVGPDSYLWTETDAVSDGTDAWGRALARFPFTDGQVLTPAAADLEKHEPVPGATATTAAVDPAHGRLAMRYRRSGRTRVAVYALDDLRARRYTPLADVAQPPAVAAEHPFQGYAVHGRYLYMLEGSAYGTPGSAEPTGNTHVTCVDLGSGAVVDRRLTRAGYTLPFREPEGMAVQLDGSRARLCMGFASGEAGARLASVYYKDLLV